MKNDSFPIGRWTVPTPDPLLVGKILGTLEAHLRAGPVEAESLEPRPPGQRQPFTDDRSVELQGGDPGKSLTSLCRHSWFTVGPCRDGKLKCLHCNTILVTEP